MKPLPSSYFSEYADPDAKINDRSYSKNWKDYGFERFRDYLKVLGSRYQNQPRSVLECGSADGSVINELSRMGIQARGIEFSKSILKTSHPDTRKLIARGNSIEVVKVIPDNSFDCVYETAAQYIPEQYLEEYFRNLARITRRDLVIILHTIEEDPEPHDHQVNHWSNKHWRELLESCGFTLSYKPPKTSEDRNAGRYAPFYFTITK
jgi:SAM-dependent methyltransferase